MKKRRVILLLVPALLLAGCGGIAKAEETTVTVDENGRITQALVEDFSQENYSRQELEEEIDGLIEAYNGETQSSAVSR